MLNVVIQSVIKLSVVMEIDVMLNVVAPLQRNLLLKALIAKFQPSKLISAGERKTGGGGGGGYVFFNSNLGRFAARQNVLG
jgi:hypothetical protein